MNLIEAILLGAVQGITEFLPVSSTGHLLLTRQLFGIQQEGQAAFIFDVLVQLGTWVAIVIYYWRDLLSIARDMLRDLRGQPAPQARLGWLLALATVPGVIAGWLVKDAMTGAVNALLLTGAFLLVNALLLAAAERIGRRTRELKEVNRLDAIVVGVFQAAALLPAISRSASTLAGGLARNFTRPEAARFAFLLAVPIMPAAAVVALLDLGSLPSASGLLLPLATGFLVSALVGFVTIRWLLNYLSRHSSYPFAIYCLAVGAAAILLSFMT